MQLAPTSKYRDAIKASIRRDSLLRFVQDSQPGYMPGWVHREVCTKLEQFSRDVAAGKSPRLMLFLPPRHGKSFIASERFPVWHLGHNPRHRVVCASYGVDLSTKFSKRARGLLEGRFASEVFHQRPEWKVLDGGERKIAVERPALELLEGSKAITDWEVTGGGGYKAVGVGSALTGHGADILIIDDPVKDMAEANSEAIREGVKEWYQSTARTRIMPGGGILVIMTRWHEDDLAGWLLKEAAESPDADQWEVISFPAIAEADEWQLPNGSIVRDNGAIDFKAAKAKIVRKKGEALHPERYPASYFKALQRFERTWAALYQQHPTAATGNVFKWKWFQYYGGKDQPALPAKFDEILQSWDCAFKDTKDSDYVVGQVWGRRGGEYWLLDQVRGQMGLPETVEAIKNLSKKWPQARLKLIEDKANGPAVMQTLRGKLSGIVAMNPEGGKEARAAAATPFFEAGNVWLPDSSIADWINDYTVELTSFPKVKHDDQVDATSQALIRFGKPKGRTTTIEQLQAIQQGGR